MIAWLCLMRLGNEIHRQHPRNRAPAFPLSPLRSTCQRESQSGQSRRSAMQKELGSVPVFVRVKPPECYRQVRLSRSSPATKHRVALEASESIRQRRRSSCSDTPNPLQFRTAAGQRSSFDARLYRRVSDSHRTSRGFRPEPTPSLIILSDY